MKIGEVWKYKHWVAKLIDEHLGDYINGKESPTALVRIRITKIDHDIVWFQEYQTHDSEHNIQRQAFIQIFEKVYE